MANKSKLQIVIEVDDKGSIKIRRLGKDAEKAGERGEKGFRKMNRGADSLNRTLKQVAATLALWKIAQITKNLALMAARYVTLGVVIKVVGRNAGYSAAAMAEYQKSLEKSGIAMIEARHTLIRMAQAHIDLTKATRLGRIAQDAAVIGNINSSEAFERLIYGIQTAQVRILKTIGINVNFQRSYKALAGQLHKNINALTEQEKTQARVNAVMEAGTAIAGTYKEAMGTAGKQILSMKRYVDNLKIRLGMLFQPALTLLVFQFSDALKGINSSLEGNKDAIHGWGVAMVHTVYRAEAEFTRFAMLLDKIGGSLTTVGMLLTAPGKSLGIASSTKKFNAFAQANIDYEKRYNASIKSLQRLADSELRTINKLNDGWARNSAAASKLSEETRKLYDTGHAYTVGLPPQIRAADILTKHILQSGENKVASWKAQEKAIKATEMALRKLADTGKNYDVPLPAWMAGTDALTQNILDQSDLVEATTDSTTQYVEDRWKQAYDGIQSSLADWIYNWKISFDSIVDMFKRMLAEMVAAWLMNMAKMQIGKWLSGSGGWVGALGDWLSGSSAGGGAGGSGGWGSAGSSAAGQALKGWVAENTSAGFSEGLSTATSTIGLGAGAYGVYSGVNNMSHGHPVGGAVQTGVGAYSMYGSAESLGLVGSSSGLTAAPSTVGIYTGGSMAAGTGTATAAGTGTATAGGTTVMAGSGSTVVVASGTTVGGTAGTTAAATAAGASGGTAASGTAGGMAGTTALGIVGIMAAAAYLLANSSTSTQYRDFQTSKGETWSPVKHEGSQSAYFDAQQGLIDEAARGAKFGFDDMTKSIADFRNGIDVLTNKFHDGFAQMYKDVQEGNTSFKVLAETMAKAGGVAIDVSHDQEQAMRSLAEQAAGGSRAAFLGLIQTMQMLGITTQNAQTAALAMISAMSKMAATPTPAAIGPTLTQAMAEMPIQARLVASAHAIGGVFTAPVHLFGEAGPEAVIPLHSGPDTLRKMDAKLDALAGRPVEIRIESTTTLDGEVLDRHTERITHRVIEDRDRSGVSRVLWAAA